MVDPGQNESASSDNTSDLRARLREAEDLAQIGRAANSTLKLNEIFSAVSTALENYVQFDRIAISIRQHDGQYKRVFVSGVDDPALGVSSFTVRDESSLERNLDGSLIVSGLGKELRQSGSMQKLGLLSWAEVPINTPQGKVGYLSVRSKIENAYSDSDIQRLKKAADQLAPAIINAQLFDQTQQESELRSVLAEVARIATSALDIGDVYHEIALAILRVIPADRLVVSSYQENGTQGSTEYSHGVEMQNYEIGSVNPIPPDVAEFIFDIRAPFLVDDEFIKSHPALNNIYQDGLRTGFNSWMIAPLIWKDEAIGGLHFRHTSANAYNDDHLRTAAFIAQQISGAVASSLDYRKERRANEIQNALASISIVASQNLELEHVYSTVARELATLVQFDRFAVIVYDRDNERLTVDYEYGLSPEGDYVGRDISSPTRQRSWKWHLEQNLEPEPTPRDLEMEKLGLKSWIQAPFGMQTDGPDGFISLRSLNENQYTEEDGHLLNEIARRITPAVQNARLYEQTRKLNEQRQRAHALDEENIELQRIADARSEFLSTVSHELRTPLTSISAFADILARNRPNNLESAQLQQIDAIQRSAVTLTGLIDDLLDVSRADVQQLSIVRAPFSFSALLDEVVAESHQTLSPKNQTLVINKPEGAIKVDADRSRITQVLNNIVSNASKYSEPGKEITVEVTAAKGKLNVQVTDHGIGIAPNDLPSVFAPFFRASDVKTQQQPGTGLGLTIVKTIVELHLREIHVESQLNEGTTVAIWIPGLLPS